jgi:glycosyltransferase involved in cell wall biosynthesis
MNAVRRIAFYAPMKSPNHTVPSGDRQVGRLFIAALNQAGYKVGIASEFRAYEKAGDPERQSELMQQGEDEAAKLIDHYRRHPDQRPGLWFTYHLYHKAPDWLGPRVSAALNIPYVIAEGSFAPKQAGGPWDLNYRASETALLQADCVLCMTKLDLACITNLRQARPSTWFPPFLDIEPGPGRVQARQDLAQAHNLALDKTWLLTVAMMRPRDKLPSYRILAEALGQLKISDWQLLIVGDGPARAEVEELFRPYTDNVCFVGEQTQRDLPRYYAAADIYAWPAINEAYGMALLEAQAAGTPVIAGAEPGVRDVVNDGETGYLTPVGDAVAFGQALDDLLCNRAHRQQLAINAASFVQGERNLAAAAGRLKTIIDGLIR